MIRNIFIYLILLLSIYLDVKLYFFFQKKPDINYNLKISRKGLYFRLIFLLAFFFFFVIFVRFLNLFREKNVIDLNIVLNKILGYDYIMIILFLVFVVFFFINFIFFFKITFLRVHYYLMHPEKFEYYDEYSGFLYKFSTWHNRFVLFFLLKDIYWFHFNRVKMYFLLKHGFTILLLVIFVYEIIFNNFCLNYFVLFLPWYSLYKLLYGFNSYIIYNMDYLYDLVVSGSIYSVDESLHYKLYSNLDYQGFFFQHDEYENIREYIRNKLFSK